eukprot:m51a1_g523 hypothetical protein (513) ;mRNA; f:352042-353878
MTSCGLWIPIALAVRPHASADVAWIRGSFSVFVKRASIFSWELPMSLDDVLKQGTTQPELAPRKWPHIVLMLFMTLPLIAISQAAVVALPNEVRRMSPAYASQISGAVGATGSLLSLLSLAVGALSDHHSFGPWWGRRRPFIVLGALGVLAASACWFVGDLGSRLWLVGAAYLLLFISTSFTSVISALVPDTLPSTQHGLASGIIGVLTAVGAGCCYGLMATGFALWAVMGALGFFAAVSAFPTVFFASPATKGPLWAIEGAKGRGACSDGLQGFMFDPRKHPDWVMLLFVNMCFAFVEGSAQFGQYWVADTLDVASPLQFVGMTGLATLVIAVVLAVPIGWLSDRVGRKPFMVMSLALLASTSCITAFVTNLRIIICSVVVSGVGTGMILSVTTAVACDTMPSSRDSAKHLAVIRLFSTIGQFTSQLLYGAILGFFKIAGDSDEWLSSTSSSSGRMYSAVGYRLVFMTTASMCIVGAVLSAVMSPRRGKDAQIREEGTRFMPVDTDAPINT